MIPLDFLSCSVLFIGIIPALLGIKCMGEMFVKFLFRKKIRKKGKVRNQEKQAILFYNLRLPCIIWSIPCIFIFCSVYVDMIHWGDPRHFSWNLWQSLTAAMAIGYLFGIFNIFYHLGYFIYARLSHHKYYVNKKSLAISLIGDIVYTLIGILAWAWLGAMSV